jgi:hypothetical protein
MPENHDSDLLALMRAMATGDMKAAGRLLGKQPALATTALKNGATRQTARQYFLRGIGFYVYAGATALHAAAAAHDAGLLQRLLDMGADVRAKDRRGAEPLHAAAMGMPGSPRWNPSAQAAAIVCLLKAGADPNSADLNGATALHRAVRTRCGAAVKALLDGGADPGRKNKNGSTAAALATRNTGRGGSGSRAAKEQQEEIRLLLQRPR